MAKFTAAFDMPYVTASKGRSGIVAMDPADDEMVKNFGLGDFCSSGNVAWKRRIGATAFIRKCDSSSETLAEATGRHCVIMSLFAMTTSRFWMLCADSSALKASKGGLVDAASYFSTISLEPSALWRWSRLCDVSWLGSRTRATTVRIGTTEQFGDETFADAPVATGDEIRFRHGLLVSRLYGSESSAGIGVPRSVLWWRRRRSGPGLDALAGVNQRWKLQDLYLYLMCCALRPLPHIFLAEMHLNDVTYSAITSELLSTHICK
jgi:hypothetical protein